MQGLTIRCDSVNIETRHGTNEIILDIKAGMDTKDRAKSLFIVDRIEAIRTAVALAKPESIILVAGKGHEDYQILGTEKISFDDRVVARQILETKSY